MDYIKLNYLSHSYKVLNPDAILYLHTSLNHLVLSYLNTFHIIALHSQSSFLKPSHLMLLPQQKLPYYLTPYYQHRRVGDQFLHIERVVYQTGGVLALPNIIILTEVAKHFLLKYLIITLSIASGAKNTYTLSLSMHRHVYINSLKFIIMLE